MTRNASFWRKVGYMCAIALLFVPLSLISAPAKTRESGGGILSRMRREERLSQAQLGKIDPASASMSLATLGMRGVAANQLWSMANHYKKTENWDAFKATLNQISKLQPNFVSVWQFQAWNISYNVSVEFDDYRHRYHWVKKGVDYLREGNEYNEKEPLLLWDTGWFFGHKMGRADEYVQFRRLFRDDTDFHGTLPIQFDDPDNQGPDEKPDNWKVAHNYFNQAEVAVDSGRKLKSISMGRWEGNRRVIGKKETALRGKNPLIFHSDPPKALINYAEAIEQDGYLDEVGQLAWRDASRKWIAYGDRPILSSYGIKIRLNDRERTQKIVDEASKKLDEIAAGVEARLRAEREASITEEEQAALDAVPSERTPEQTQMYRDVTRRLEITPMQLAEATDPSSQKEAKKLATQLLDAQSHVTTIDRYRGIVNYLYWKKRCEAEQLPVTVAARKLVREADELFAEAYIDDAKVKYEEAWEKWDEVYQDYDILIDDVEGEITYEAVMRYKKLLGQLDIDFPPPNFKLKRLLEEYGDLTTPTTSPEDGNEESEAVEDEMPEGAKSLEVNDSSTPVESKDDAATTEDPNADAPADASEKEMEADAADSSATEPASSGDSGDAEATEASSSESDGATEGGEVAVDESVESSSDGEATETDEPGTSSDDSTGGSDTPETNEEDPQAS